MIEFCHLEVAPGPSAARFQSFFSYGRNTKFLSISGNTISLLHCELTAFLAKTSALKMLRFYGVQWLHAYVKQSPTLLTPHLPLLVSTRRKQVTRKNENLQHGSNRANTS